MREIFWLRLFPGLLRSSTVCRYRLGEPAAG